MLKIYIKIYCTLPGDPSDLKGEDQMPQREDGLSKIHPGFLKTL